MNKDNGHAKENKKVKQEWSRHDTEMMVATRQSYSQRAKQRKALSFETTEEAVERARKRKRQEEIDQRKIKRHSLSPTQVDFNKENLLREVTNMKDGDMVKLISCEINKSSCTLVYSQK